jgi:hypothetical protein
MSFNVRVRNRTPMGVDDTPSVVPGAASDAESNEKNEQRNPYLSAHQT